MADAKLQTIMEKMQEKLNDERDASGKLSFMVDTTNNKVEIITDPDSYSGNFRYYSILLYPVDDDIYEEIPKIGNRVERVYRVGVSCRRKLSKRRKFIFFSNPNEANVPVGIIEMSNRVKDILRYNTLDSTLQPHSGRQFENDELVDDDPYMNTHEFVWIVHVLSTVTSSGVD